MSSDLKCIHCGQRIQRSYFTGSWSNDWIHVTLNGDSLGTYCQLQQATPAPSPSHQTTTEPQEAP